MITLQEIESSPGVKGSWEPGRKDKNFAMAFYSTSCCWWTSFPEDLGKAPQPFHIPCCPYCGSTLMEAPLDKFIEAAKENPDHYGSDGLIAFVASHHRSGFKCKKFFKDYK